jgi:putative acetyltransferase
MTGSARDTASAVGQALTTNPNEQRLRKSLRIRLIRSADDPAVATIIRTVMPEFGASGQGFAINDPEVDFMSRAYRGARSRYWVVEGRDGIVGGGGFAPLEGGAKDTCELRKMYFLQEARGLGLGAELLALCLREAKRARFRVCYLETLAGMTSARRLYETFGFERLEKPKGKTGHFGCDAWYARKL